MNKVLLVGRLVRDPETQTTASGIKYTRFTIAVSRSFGDDQTDFIPVVAWRSQADFIEKYLGKGSQVSVEGRFTSSSYKNQENQNVTRYEVTADRVESLESKAQSAGRKDEDFSSNPSATATQVIKFESSSKPAEEETKDVPWDLDL